MPTLFVTFRLLPKLTQLSEGQVIFVAIVRIRDGEAFEQAFRRFKKSCEKAGILSELKKREHFEKPSVQKKKKSIAARKRAMKKTRRG
jgi:small subunit ribosomal protein S21